MWMAIIWVVLGVVLLLIGGEWLVRGASRLGQAARVSPLVAGLTIVAVATSAPELAVSVRAALAGESALAVGNVTGSNIANIGLILGLAALASPLHVPAQVARFDVRVMFGLFVAMGALGLDGSFSAYEGIALLTALTIYLTALVVTARRVETLVGVEAPVVRLTRAQIIGAAALTATGLGLLVSGADRLVAGAVDLARLLGISERVIGLTIVAVGTSLPELAASVVATLRGEREIALGNVVGSNVFNILGVLGATTLAAPAGLTVLPQTLALDFPIMLTAGLACLVVCRAARSVHRWEGAALFGGYVLYLVILAIG